MNVFASILSMNVWYALPLVVTISLVYAATRHEDMPNIIKHAANTAIWILGFMAIIFAILYSFAWWL